MDEPPAPEPLVGREDALDDASYQIREVYAQYGLTNYASQVMEKGLLNTLVLKANAESATPTQKNFDVLFEQYARLTLGHLLRAFKRTLPAESDAYDALITALPLRNFIAHTFFWDRAVDFMSVSGRESMLAELIKARAIFEETDALVSLLTRRVAADAGIDPERFEELLSSAMTDLRRGIQKD